MKNDIQKQDAIIIGAGPAGLFAAYRILENQPNANVLLIERGSDIQFRECYQNCSICPNYADCSMLCGVGGSGLFSDGKLVLDLHAGGLLDSISNITEQRKNDISKYIERTLRSFDGVSQDGPKPSKEVQKEWLNWFNQNGLEIKHYDVLHMGSKNLRNIITKFLINLKEKPGFKILTSTEVTNVYKKNNLSFVEVLDGRTFISTNILFSVGKTGSEWLKDIFIKNQISFKKNTTYIGVRVETSHDFISKLFEFSFDPKIWMYFDNHKVKTHCFCRHGDVICTNYMGFPVVGGQTQITENNNESINEISKKSNFNVLVSTSLDENRIINLLEDVKKINPDGPVVQSISSFINNCKDLDPIAGLSDNVKVGNLREIFNQYDGIGRCIVEFISRLEKIVPNLTRQDGLIYAPAIEWFMDTVNVKPNMETSCSGWFAIGDGAGLSQGIVHAAATAIIAADDVSLRITK